MCLFTWVGVYDHTSHVFIHTSILQSVLWIYSCPIPDFKIEITASLCSFLSLNKKISTTWFCFYAAGEKERGLTEWVSDWLTHHRSPDWCEGSPWPGLCFCWHESHSRTSVAAVSRDWWPERSLACHLSAIILLDTALAFSLQCVPASIFNSWNSGYVACWRAGQHSVRSVICKPLWVITPCSLLS